MDRIIVEADAKKTGYRYFAFISYSSKDVKWAEWIQKKLETYRLPSKIRKEHSDLPEKIAPVFRDDTDLSGVVLEEALHKELDESKFLIVVCTPESAASKWVGDEIKYFRSIGGEKRIIPLIVGSETDLIDECVHEEIKRIKPELLGIDVDKLGKSNAFLRLVATMLELHYDELLMRERKSWIKRRIVAGVAAFLLLSGMIGLWYYNAEHSSYYSNYILRYEIPEGVEKLSGSDVAKRVSSYKIVKKRGKVIRLETVNNKKVLSSGIVYYEEINEFPLQEYSYDDSGRLSEITMKNENRDIIGVKSLSYGEGNIAIDYRYAEDGISVNTNDSAYGYYIDGETGRSEVIRQINSYNEEGFRTEERYYRDNLGHTAVNELGVYGKQYVYTDEGFIESVIFIDDNGKKSNCKYGYAEMRQEYSGSKINKSTYLDEKGAPARNSKGVSIYEAEYDEVGNYIKIERFSEEGNLCKDKDNVAVMYFSTEKGEYQGAKYYDEENNPTLNDTGVHEVRWKRNKDGWIIEENYYDTEGKAVRVKGDNYTSISIKRDESGRINEWKYYDAEGNPCCNKSTGSYMIRQDYDKNGFIEKVYCLDADGKLMRGKDGWAILECKNNSKGERIEERYFDENGMPCRNTNNIAIGKYVYDAYGNNSEVYFYDENEEPCYSKDKIAVMKREYENGSMTSEKYFDTKGEAMLDDGKYHEIRYTYDELGYMKTQSFHKIDGSLTNGGTAENYALAEYEYDRYGNCILWKYYDLNMEFSTNYTYSSIEAKYDSRGNLIYQRYETSPHKTLGYYIYEAKYDRNDNRTEEYYCDKEGNPIYGLYKKTFEYDDKNRNTGTGYYYSDGSYKTEDYGFDIYGNSIWGEQKIYDEAGKVLYEKNISLKYDEFGNNTEYAYTDGRGNLTVGEEGWALKKREYSPEGYVFAEEYYGINREPVLCDNVYFRLECKYDHAGNTIEARSYGVDGTPLSSETGLAACVYTEYDAVGRILYKKWLDENEDPFFSYFYAMGYEYSPLGGNSKIIYYDENDGIIAEEVYCVIVGEVYETFGYDDVAVGDILLKYGDWVLNPEEDIVKNYETLYEEISKKRGKRKTIVVYSVDKGRIISHNHDDDRVLRLVDKAVDVIVYNKALKLFEAYK